MTGEQSFRSSDTASGLSGGEDLLLQAGDRVEQFKVICYIARGGMGEVYLARDMTLGRKVAIKVVRRQEALSKESIECFLFEAQATANLNHPNIVTIFHAGQHEGLPYVVMEYLEGQNLRSRLYADPPGQKEVLRLCLAVARALREAHARQIVHRDLKPENLLVPVDGRLRVVDFGLARILERPIDAESEEDLGRLLKTVHQVRLDEPPSVRGSPPYMAPEQWKQQESGGATDIWALGIIMHELLTGERPNEGYSFIELAALATGVDPIPLRLEGPRALGGPYHPRLVALLKACLDRDQTLRPSAEEVAGTLEGMLHGSRPPRNSDAAPFRGLAPFGEEHADLFFGRDAELLEFLEKLRHQAVLPVVGPSGAGKSSFVQAGVIPRLREWGGWTVLRMRPGEAPFRALAARLAAGETQGIPTTVQPPDDEETDGAHQKVTSGFQTLETTLAEEEALASELRHKPHLLSLALRRLAAQQEGKVLLLVDQLEELHTLTSDPAERRAFMEAVCGAADEASDPVRVILTLREDFLSRLTLGPLVRVVMGQLTVMRKPEPRALRQILTRPLELQNHRFDDDLLPVRMVQEVEGERAALPLLQFAARRLWERRDREARELRLADFEEMGGVAGALASHADGVVDDLEPAEREAARELLLRLVTAEKTRQVVERDHLLDGLGVEGDNVLQRLIAARLLTSRRGTGATGGIELVHESLIHTWHRLARWLEESREDLVFLEEAGRAADLWQRKGGRDVGLWTGQALLEAEAAMARCSTAVPAPVRQFVRAGQRRRDRNTWRLRTLSFGLLLAVSLAAVIFFLQRQEADRQRQVADAERKSARAHLGQSLLEGTRAAVARGERLEARARLRSSMEIADSVAARGLWWRLARDPLVWTRRLGSGAYSAAISPDGKEVAVSCQDGAVYLVDRVTRETRVLRGFGGQINFSTYSSDGKWLAVGTSQHRIHLRRRGQGTERILRGHSGTIWSMAFSPDNRLLASGGNDLSIIIHDLSGAAPVRVDRAHKIALGRLAFSPDGGILASTSGDGTVGLWRPRDGTLIRRLVDGAKTTVGLAFHPSGETLAVGTTGGRIAIWDPKDGSLKRVLRSSQAKIISLGFTPDGATLVAGAMSPVIRLWGFKSGKVLQELRSPGGRTKRMHLSSDGRHLVTAGADRTARLWRLDSTPKSTPQGGHTAAVDNVDISPDGETIASASYDGSVILWDRATGRRKRALRPVGGRMVSVAFSPDSRRLFLGNDQGVLVLMDPATGKRLATHKEHKGKVFNITFSPDGKHLATCGGDGFIRIRDSKSGNQLWAWETHKTTIKVAFSPDGKTMAASVYGGEIVLSDWRTGKAIRVFRGHTHTAWGLAFTTGGESLITTAADATVRQFPLTGGSPQVLSRPGSPVYAGGVSPDGQLISAPLADGRALLLGRDGEVKETLRGHRGEVNALLFARRKDQPWAVSASDDSTVRLWNYKKGRSGWFTVLMSPDQERVLTHRGWEAMGAPSGKAAAPKKEWAAAAQKDGWLGDTSEEGAQLCLLTHEGKLELWDLKKDQRRFQADEARADRVQAAAGGCLVRQGKEARLYRQGGSYHKLSSHAEILASQGGEILVGATDKVELFDREGRVKLEQKVGAGATALGLSGQWLVAGFPEGNLELHRQGSRKQHLSHSFEDVPSSPVERIIPGPMDTLVVGFANGTVGLWERDTGTKLYAVQLHGPVAHLRLHKQKLYAASELGDHVTLDLGVFYRPFKELRAEVEKKVPVIWKEGRIQLAH